jgi:hypothetical protein
MNATNNNSNKQPATTTQRLLAAVLVLQVLTLLGLWTGQPGLSHAAAAIPDPGAQREAMVEQQKETNQKLDKLLTLLTSGDVKVKFDDKDK